MGSLQSSLVLSAAVAVAGLGVAYWLIKPGLTRAASGPELPKAGGSASLSGSKKGKKKKPAAVGGSGPGAGASIGAGEKEKRLPGALDVDDEGQTTTTVPDEGAATPVTTAGKKKKKSKSASTPAPSSNPSTRALHPPTLGQQGSALAQGQGTAGPSNMEADGPWTRVETRRRGNSARGSSLAGAGQSSSDLQVEGSVGDVTTSVTEEESGEPADGERAVQAQGEMRSTVERMLPRPRKTAVDDMLETPEQSVSRVIRVTPLAAEKPAAGFTWADYEDVEDRGGMADGEDDEGEWGIVKSRNKRATSQSAIGSGSTSSSSQARPAKAPETLTKKQRQNARKREQDKALKSEAEADRQAQLRAHKRELENERMKAQASGAGRGKNTLSGGMRASVNDKGALVWEDS